MRASRGSFCERSAARNGSSGAAAIVCAQRIKFFQKRKILREKSVVKIFSIWYNKSTVAAIAASKMSDGGIAQLVRALASHARGRRFESYCLYHAKRHPFSGAFLRGREGREPRAPKGKEKEEENKSRVVRARAKPDALPRGPLRGIGKYLLSLPKRG